MRLRIGVRASFHGTHEIDVPEGDIERRGGINAYVEHSPEDWAQEVYQQGGDVDVDIDDLDRWDEEEQRWVMVAEGED